MPFLPQHSRERFSEWKRELCLWRRYRVGFVDDFVALGDGHEGVGGARGGHGARCRCGRKRSGRRGVEGEFGVNE